MGDSDIASRCFTPSEIEALAGAMPGTAINGHLTICGTCRDALEEARSNNEFIERMRRSSREDEATVPLESPADNAMPPGYSVIREINRGGQGIVYECIQTRTRRHVAIKILTSPSTTAVVRFRHEVEIVASLDHPGIVQIFDSGATFDGRLWVAMELVQGLPFDAWATGVRSFDNSRRTSRQRSGRIVRAMQGVCDAVQYAHEHGVIHRDLKPGNVVVSADGTPRVLDFGIAKIVGNQWGALTRATMTGAFVGTPAYAAPEQVSGNSEAVGTTTDVYALGVMLYESMTGRMPYDVSGPILTVAENILHAPPCPPSVVDPGIDDELTTIILKALSKDPARRYRSAREFGTDLARYEAGTAIEAKRDSAWYVVRKSAVRHRIPIVITLAIISLLATLAIQQTVSARHLERALVDSTIARARATAATNAVESAAELLWPEFLSLNVELTGDPDILFSAPPLTLKMLWALLEIDSRQPCMAMRSDPADLARELAFSDDETSITITHQSGRRTSWTFHGQETRELARPSVELMPGERVIASALDNQLHLLQHGTSNKVRLVDTRREKQARSVEGISSPAFASLSPDGRWMWILESNAKELWLYDTRTLARQLCALPIATHSKGITATWSPDADRLALMLEGHRLAIVECDGLTAVETLEVPIELSTWPSAAVRSLRFSPDGTMLACAADSVHVAAWRLAEPRRPMLWSAALAGSIGTIAFSGDSLRFMIEREGTIDILNVANGLLVQQIWYDLPLAAKPIINHDGSTIAYADAGGITRVYRQQRWMKQVEGHRGTVGEIAADSLAQVAVSIARDDPTIRVWPLTGGEPFTFDSAHRDVTGISIAAGGTRILTSGHEGDVKLWDAQRGSLLGVLAAHGCETPSVSLNPDASLAASADEQGRLWLTDVATRTTREIASQRARIPCVRFSRDGTLLGWTGGADRTARIIDIRSGAMTSFQHDGAVRDMAFSPDGSLFATSADDTTVSVWDVTTRDRRSHLQGHRVKAYGVAFHPRGIILASVDKEGVVKLWDVRTGDELASFRIPGQRSFCVTFTTDGRSLLIGGEPKSMYCFHLTAMFANTHRAYLFHKSRDLAD